MEAMASGKLPQPDQTDAERLRQIAFSESTTPDLRPPSWGARGGGRHVACCEQLRQTDTVLIPLT